MIVLRNKSFTLPDSRKGIGWVNDKNGKLDSEKYFKAARDAADKAEARGKSDEEIIKSSKRAAGMSALKDHSGKPLIDAAKYGGLAYLGAKLAPRAIIDLSATTSYNRLGQVGKILRDTKAGRKVVANAMEYAPTLNKHAGKIGLAAAMVGAGIHYPRVSKKVKSAALGAEINTVDRIKKRNNKKK